MKSILFLLLSTAFTLLPFVAFSSTSTSDNPIITLPTSTNDNRVLDVQGAALHFGARYRIVSSFRGAAGGDVILGTTPTTDKCPNGVFRQSSDVGPGGTPVEFIATNSATPSNEISETDDIIIRFAIATTKLCVSYTYWKVGDYDVSLGARLLETGGSSFFRIVKAPVSSSSYNLLYCPGPFECPSCPANQCQVVGEVIQNGRRRLALGGDRALLVAFRKL